MRWPFLVFTLTLAVLVMAVAGRFDAQKFSQTHMMACSSLCHRMDNRGICRPDIKCLRNIRRRWRL